LPSDEILIQYIKEAMLLSGKSVKKIAKPKKEIVAPDYFMDTLKTNAKAFETYQKLPPSHKREYLEWITDAKTDVTREKRINTTLEWLAEGKSKNWKYEKK
jgi:uncharacterized protein YdeI (YjbR/CyaY-like superfamily)